MNFARGDLILGIVGTIGEFKKKIQTKGDGIGGVSKRLSFEIRSLVLGSPSKDLEQKIYTKENCDLLIKGKTERPVSEESNSKGWKCLIL